MSHDIAYILSQKLKGREWSLNGEGYDQLMMLDGLEKPSLEQLKIWGEDIRQEKLASQYKTDRFREYPPLEDLIIALWEKIIENRPEPAEALQVIRSKVKEKYPKPSE